MKKNKPRVIFTAMCILLCTALLLPCGCSELDSLAGGESSMYSVAAGRDGTAEVTAYNGAGKALTVPASISGRKVSAIADGAFEGNAAIVSVSLPESVKRIGANAFSGCSSLESIGLGGVTQVGDNAFSGCVSLAEADLSSAADIGAGAFEGCSALRGLTLGEGKDVRVGERCFSGCDALASFDGGQSAKIEAFAFADCVSLEKVTFDGKARLAGEAFSGCSMLYSARFTGSKLPHYMEKWTSSVPTFPEWTTIEYSSKYLQKHRRVVYSDSGDKSRHFTLIVDGEGESGDAVSLTENCPIDPANGKECIDCVISLPEGDSAAGWIFMNQGYDEDGHVTAANGMIPNCGTDLKGAKELVFYARSENGGERVSFFMGGTGRREDEQVSVPEGEDGEEDSEKEEGSLPYPDSTAKITRRFTLTDNWQRFSIDLSGCDLSYIQCGFGFTCVGADCGQEVELYLDDIYFEGDFQ